MPWVHWNFCIYVHPLMWHRFWRHCHGGLLCYPPSIWWFRCLFHPQKLCRGGVHGSCGTAMLKMDANLFLPLFAFLQDVWDGAGFWSASWVFHMIGVLAVLLLYWIYFHMACILLCSFALRLCLQRRTYGYWWVSYLYRCYIHYCFGLNFMIA